MKHTVYTWPRFKVSPRESVCSTYFVLQSKPINSGYGFRTFLTVGASGLLGTVAYTCIIDFIILHCTVQLITDDSLVTTDVRPTDVGELRRLA